MKRCGEEEKVAATLRELGHVDGELVDAMVKILAETALADSLLKVFVRSADKSDVDVYLLRSAYWSDATLLQRTQQLHLHFVAQVAHLVEEQRAAVGYLERAALVGVGASERSLLMTEKLGCCNVTRNRSAVECEERTVVALTEVVNAVSYVLLAGARRSEYENGHWRRSHQLYVAV